MKKQKSETLFQVLLGSLTHNWWLKLLALALAIATYFSLTQTADSPTKHDTTLLQLP